MATMSSWCCEERSVLALLRHSHGMSTSGSDCNGRILTADDIHTEIFKALLQLINNWLTADKYLENLFLVAGWLGKEGVKKVFRKLLNNYQYELSADELEKGGRQVGERGVLEANSKKKIGREEVNQGTETRGNIGLLEGVPRKRLREDDETSASSKQLTKRQKYSNDETPSYITEVLEHVKIHLGEPHAHNSLRNLTTDKRMEKLTYLIKKGYKRLIVSFDNHMLEASSVSKSDVISCLVHLLTRVISEYSSVVGFISEALQAELDEHQLFELLHGAASSPNDVSDPWRILIQSAVSCGNVDLVRVLLEAPCCAFQHQNLVSCRDPETGDTLLHAACKLGVTSLKEILMSNCKSELNASGYVRLFWCVLYPGDTDLESKVSVLSHQDPVRYVEMVELLVGHGCQVDAVNNNGETPLHCAASVQLCQPQICRQLVSQLSETEKVHEEQADQTRLRKFNTLSAQYFEFTIRIVDILIRNKADVNVMSCTGDTPLLVAVATSAKCMEISQQLVAFIDRCLEELIWRIPYEKKVDKYRELLNGDVIGLPKLVRCQVFTIARHLLRHGADWQMANNAGVGVFQLAVKSGQTELVEELIGRGADVSTAHRHRI